jgi:hypothetical protein
MTANKASDLSPRFLRLRAVLCAELLPVDESF